MAHDQRYCLECGERRLPASSLLLAGRPGAGAAASVAPPGAPRVPPAAPPGEAPPQRNGTLMVIAGVGVLLLAMGVGVLIGRSGAGRQGSAAPQVITVGSVAPGTGSAAASEPSFTSSWPAGTKGFTVQLQTLPVSSTTVSAVEAAKSAATAKGAKTVGALKSEEFSSLKGTSYVIYSGVYHKRSEAQKALASLKKSFPGASVIEVSSGGSRSGSGNEGGTVSTPGGVGESLSKPAPPSVLEGLKGAKGKSYEEKSKNLPNVVGT
jgi:hypothetical protein